MYSRKFRGIPVLAVLFMAAMASAQSGAPLKSGEQVYRETCMACHGTGVAQAPRTGDRKVWAKLIAEGQAVLTSHAWVGVRGMPPKGGNPELSLEEFSRAVAWLAREAGGKWQDPDAVLMQRIQAEVNKRQAAARRKAAASK